jgi:hypothetical protein
LSERRWSKRWPSWKRLCGSGGRRWAELHARSIAFLTGHLAKARLERLLIGLGKTDFAWNIVDVGVKVTALMTEDIILRRVGTSEGDASCCLGAFAAISNAWRRIQRAGRARPRQVADLPAFLGRAGKPPGSIGTTSHLRRGRRADSFDRGSGGAGGNAVRRRR